MIDLISVLIAIGLLILSISFVGVLIYASSCFTSYCKTIGEYFSIVSTSSQGLADWDEK